MLLEFALSLSFLLLLLLLLLQKRQRQLRLSSGRTPPGPGGPPFLGQLPAFFAKALRFGRRFRFHLYLQGLSRRFGPVTAFRLGTQRFVLISGHAALREALIGRGDAFGYRMDTPFFRYLSRKRGLAMSDGPLWAEHRRFAVRAFRRLGLGGPQAEALIEAECRSLLDALADALDGRASAEVDASDLITRAIVNVISQLLFSTRADYSDSELSEYVSHLSTLTHGDFVTLLITCYPWLPIRPMLALSSGARALDRSNNWVLEFMRTRVEAVRAGRLDPNFWTDPDSQPANYVEAYLLEQQRQLRETGSVGTFDDYQLYRSAYDIYLGGTETSANSLRWLLLMAALHPDMQRRCRLEVAAAIGTDWRPVSMADREKLPFTRAFIEETLRLVVPLPLGVNSRVVRATEVLGCTVEPSDFVMLNLFATHRDPEHFPEPERFNPERFIEPESGRCRRLDQAVSFGIGRRACLGEQLAQRELLTLFGSLLSRFRFELGDAEKAEPERLEELMLGSIGLIRAPGDHRLRITRVDWSDEKIDD
ncbi:hypothetical protein BOX15_Mlig012961g3 [Macrostomum lignano]|uniref:Cytochrome P450 n=1 Tax=Macrostomum lignano TaxID=282301 RepID=A0A267DWP0_9PLAT|nr:hypothetical protein BOX15_Mlig012961g3 [Macrostomum lignano]